MRSSVTLISVLKPLCVFFALAGPAAADPMQTINWIVANSNLRYSGEQLPRVIRVRDKYMPLLVLTPEEIASRKIQGRKVPVFLAAYSERIIYLSDGVDENTAEGRAVLLHEYVHFLQDINGRSGESRSRAEGQAYLLQRHWLAEYTASPYQS